MPRPATHQKEHTYSVLPRLSIGSDEPPVPPAAPEVKTPRLAFAKSRFVLVLPIYTIDASRSARRVLGAARMRGDNEATGNTRAGRRDCQRAMRGRRPRVHNTSRPRSCYNAAVSCRCSSGAQLRIRCAASMLCQAAGALPSRSAAARRTAARRAFAAAARAQTPKTRLPAARPAALRRSGRAEQHVNAAGRCASAVRASARAA